MTGIWTAGIMDSMKSPTCQGSGVGVNVGSGVAVGEGGRVGSSVLVGSSVGVDVSAARVGVFPSQLTSTAEATPSPAIFKKSLLLKGRFGIRLFYTIWNDEWRRKDD